MGHLEQTGDVGHGPEVGGRDDRRPHRPRRLGERLVERLGVMQGDVQLRVELRSHERRSQARLTRASIV